MKFLPFFAVFRCFWSVFTSETRLKQLKRMFRGDSGQDLPPELTPSVLSRPRTAPTQRFGEVEKATEIRKT